MTLLQRIEAAHAAVANNPSLDEDAVIYAAVIEWLKDQKIALANSTIDLLIETAR